MFTNWCHQIQGVIKILTNAENVKFTLYYAPGINLSE